mgnify:CR=1 FL=1
MVGRSVGVLAGGRAGTWVCGWAGAWVCGCAGVHVCGRAMVGGGGGGGGCTRTYIAFPTQEVPDLVALGARTRLHLGFRYSFSQTGGPGFGKKRPPNSFTEGGSDKGLTMEENISFPTIGVLDWLYMGVLVSVAEGAPRIG